jgi:hypothetical protein
MRQFVNQHRQLQVFSGYRIVSRFFEHAQGSVRFEHGKRCFPQRKNTLPPQHHAKLVEVQIVSFHFLHIDDASMNQGDCFSVQRLAQSLVFICNLLL